VRNKSRLTSVFRRGYAPLEQRLAGLDHRSGQSLACRA